ncbi:hypothetical protein P5673_016999 [Acropora cervicornis]|uniref:G-protein coupled receptors family 1 profile domain-containing protein n=1 Tax=Acropora cervicornis TaxID=6130 RepID=A0AAD9QFQ1_ACRCE|nr:hypothetical protein P5673_016999 [Acropora cervicornis]
MILKLLGCYAHLGGYKVNVTGSIGGILIEINKRIEFYTCHGKKQNSLNTGVIMRDQFCKNIQVFLQQLVDSQKTALFSLCVLNFVFCPVATLGNALAIRALWKASSLPPNLRKMLLNLTFCGLAVGLFAHTTIAGVLSQIQAQFQHQNAQAMVLLRERKSALNVVYIYIVFVACYLPRFCSVFAEAITGNPSVLSLFALFFLFLNSSLNPLVYCWRLREVRQIMKVALKKIFRLEE